MNTPMRGISVWRYRSERASGVLNEAPFKDGRQRKQIYRRTCL